MKKTVRDYVLLLVFAGIIIALDQWTKEIIRTQLSFGETWVPWDWLASYARIIHWKNTGAAFGFGQNLGFVFTLLAVFVVGAILFYFPQIPYEDWPLRVAVGMQLGGAIGNLIDRLTQGFVTDFISVGTFPVFNVADSSISLGVVVLVIGAWISERRQRPSSEVVSASPSETESSLSSEEIQGE